MANRKIFVTGATGLLGTEVVSHLLSTTDDIIYVLVRADSADEGASRLRALWWDDAVLADAVGNRVLPVVGDITTSLMGVIPADVTHVIHCAAETGIQKSYAELRRINVEGTRQMVQAAKALPHLQRFTHVSTAYVAGTNSGLIMEEAPLPTSFYSNYEASKAEAETVVRTSELPFTICRPGMVIGNSKTYAQFQHHLFRLETHSARQDARDTM